MKFKILFFTVSLWSSLFFTIISCGTKEKEEYSEPDISVQTTGLNLSISDKNNDAKSEAIGPHLIDYSNYRASEIIDELSSIPVAYEAFQNPLLDIHYYFPEKTLASVQKECIDSIINFLGMHSDTILQEMDILVIRIEDGHSSPIVISTGEKLKRENNNVKMYNASSEEVRQYLENELDQHIILAEKDFCCLSTEFNLGKSMQQLIDDLKKNGIEVVKEKREVKQLRIY